MNGVIIYIVFIISCVVFAVMSQKSQACLYFGRALASETFLELDKNGYQNALSDPADNKWFFLNLSVVFGMLVAGCMYLAWYHGIFLLLIFFLVSSIVRRLLPKPSDQGYLLKIYASLARREADFIKTNDSLRAEACKTIREKIEDKFF